MQSNIEIYPGSTSYGSFLEIHFKAHAPAATVDNYRRVLSYLVEGFKESDISDGAIIRAYSVRLLSCFYPLPSQNLRGVEPLTVPPPSNENGGYYLTESGFSLRLSESGTFEELEYLNRAVIALAFCNGYELNDNARAALWRLIDGLRPNSVAVARLLFPKGLPDGYTFDANEKESISNIITVHEERAQLLRRSMETPSDRLNARWFKVLALLNSSPFASTLIDKMLQIVATGEISPDE